MGKQFTKQFFAVFLTFLLIFSSFPQVNFANEETNDEQTLEDTKAKGAYDPNEDYKHLDVRFWEDEVPGIGFYINHANLYNLTTVSEPIFGTGNGEWTVMSLLRGLESGYYYNEALTEEYFDGYINRVEEYVQNRDGNLDRNKSTEWSRSILSLSALGYDITNVAGYDYIEKLSESYSFSYRQGINGPIWEVIALNTGPYELYPDADNDDVNTMGKMVDYILDDEIEQSDGTVGGWALSAFLGGGPDVDITGMALQSLAPYYNDEALFNELDSEYSYEELVNAVERGVYILSDMQLDNGGFPAFGNVNAESTAQAIVALTALDMDPVSNVTLPSIGKTANFVTDGAVHDGVNTDNMIDKLLTFWAPGSTETDKEFESKEEELMYKISGGFKHVTSGDDGGGGSGAIVNGMGTDQTIYALVSYDRYLKGQNALYDMSDMVNGEYKGMLQASEQTISFHSEEGTEDINGKRYGLVEVKNGPEVNGKTFTGWNSKEDGSGTEYEAEEMLVVPEEDITLYAQYETDVYEINYELNNGSLSSFELTNEYTVDDEVALPTEDHLSRNGYTFVGWYDNAKFSGENITSISTGSTGDKKLFAKWEKIVDDNKVEGKKVQEQIESLPSIEEVTLDHKESIKKARNVYDSLPDEAKKHVINISKLEVAEKRIAQLEERALYKEEKENLERLIEKALGEDLSLFINDSIKSLGSKVGKAESTLRQTEKAKNGISKKEMQIMAISESTSEELQELKNARNELEDTLDNLKERDETDDEGTILTKVLFEKERLRNHDVSDLSEEKQEEIKTFISGADELEEKEDITEEEVNNFAEKVNDLVKDIGNVRDMSNLNDFLEIATNLANEIVPEEYVEETVGALQNSIDEAAGVLNNSDASEKEIDVAVNKLKEAIKSLQKIVNKDALQELYEDSNDFKSEGKTEASWDVFVEAREKAEEVLENEKATEEDVDKAVEKLQEAIENLEALVNKEDLESILDEASKEEKADKTEASWNVFKEAREKAKDILGKEDATQEEVDEVLVALREAMDGLEKEEEQEKDQEEEKDEEKPTPPGSADPSEDDKSEGEGDNAGSKGDDDSKKEDENHSGTKGDGQLGKNDPSESTSTEVGESTSGETKVEKNDSDKLPNTATPMFSMMFIGFMLVLLGFAYFVFQKVSRRKQM